MSIQAASATGNTESRDAILSSIRENLAASRPHDEVYYEHRPRSVGERIELDRLPISKSTLIDNFRSNLESVGGHCAIVADRDEARAAVTSVVHGIGAKNIAVSDSELVANVVDSTFETRKNAPVEYLFGCDLGITSAQWAIAETGTLVLESEAESHRLTSLVPPVHLCVVEAGNIRQTLGEILAATRQNLNSAVTFITGASRTSDIELTLAIGVHGPGELHVIVISD